MWLTGAQVVTLVELSDVTPICVYPKHNGRKQQKGETRNVFTPIRFVRPDDGLTGTIDENGVFTPKATPTADHSEKV